MTFVPVNNAEVKPLRKIQATPAPTVPQDVLSQAQDLVGLQYNPTQGALERALGTTQTNLQTNTKALTGYGEKVDPRIADVYSQLGGMLTGNVDRTRQLFEGAVGQVGQGYDFATQEAQKGSQGILDRIAQQAQMLGQNQRLPYAQQNILDELAGIQALNASSKAGATGNLTGLGAALQGIGNQAVSDSAREGAQVRGDIQQNVIDQIAKLQLGAQTESNETMAKLVDLLSNRGAAERTTVQEILGDRAKSKAQADQQNFDNQLAVARLTGGGESANPLDTEYKTLRNQNLGLDIAKKMGVTPDAPKVQDVLKTIQAGGVTGLNAWFNYSLKGPSGHQKRDYGYFKSGVRKLITGAQASAGSEKNLLVAKQKALDIIAQAVQENALQNDGKFVFDIGNGKTKSFPADEVMNAARVYFGQG